MDCTTLISDILSQVTIYKPIEYAPHFIDFMIKIQDNCPKDIMSTLTFLKENYQEHYIQIMIAIGKGG